MSELIALPKPLHHLSGHLLNYSTQSYIFNIGVWPVDQAGQQVNMITYLAAAATGFARPTGRDGGGGSTGVPPPAVDLLGHYLLLESDPLSTGPWSKW